MGSKGLSRYPLPALTVGVMGSAGGDLKQEVRDKVKELGREIARRGYVLITGAAPGLPHDAVLGAKSVGAWWWEYRPLSRSRST